MMALPMTTSAVPTTVMACRSLIVTPAGALPGAGPPTHHLGRAAALRRNVLRVPRSGSAGAASARPCAARATSSGRDPFTMDPFSDPYSDPFTMASDIEASVNNQIRKVWTHPPKTSPVLPSCSIINNSSSGIYYHIPPAIRARISLSDDAPSSFPAAADRGRCPARHAADAARDRSRKERDRTRGQRQRCAPLQPPPLRLT